MFSFPDSSGNPLAEAGYLLLVKTVLFWESEWIVINSLFIEHPTNCAAHIETKQNSSYQSYMHDSLVGLLCMTNLTLCLKSIGKKMKMNEQSGRQN